LLGVTPPKIQQDGAVELTTMICHPFREPLGSALPYRQIISEELFDMMETLMDESRILLLKVSRNLSLLTTNCGRETILECKKPMY